MGKSLSPELSKLDLGAKELSLSLTPTSNQICLHSSFSFWFRIPSKTGFISHYLLSLSSPRMIQNMHVFNRYLMNRHFFHIVSHFVLEGRIFTKTCVCLWVHTCMIHTSPLTSATPVQLFNSLSLLARFLYSTNIETCVIVKGMWMENSALVNLKFLLAS